MKLPTSVGSIGSVFRKKQRNSRKTSTSASLTVLKPLNCVDHNKLWKILQVTRIPGHHTCLLRNLDVGQEATIRTEHGTMYWFNWERSMTKLYIVTLLGSFIC